MSTEVLSAKCCSGNKSKNYSVVVQYFSVKCSEVEVQSRTGLDENSQVKYITSKRYFEPST